MPKLSKATATTHDHGPVRDVTGTLDGYTAEWVTFREDLDGTPLLKGCKDDRCQCAHWGLVLSGRITFRYADREEVFETGDAFYTPAGHIPVGNAPGTELFMFSPTQELLETEAVIDRNLAAMMPAS